MSEPPPPLRTQVPYLSPKLEEVVLRMLAKNPEERPTARELLEELPPLLIDGVPPGSNGLTAEKKASGFTHTLGNLLRRFTFRTRALRQIFMGPDFG
jgi:serine/threonine protein kinase